MTSPELENLVRLGHLKREACSQRDFDNLVKSGTARLTDAANPVLSIAARFDLASNAAHALALAALRHRGFFDPKAGEIVRSKRDGMKYYGMEELAASSPVRGARCNPTRTRVDYEAA